ncbi:60S ribosomal protein L6 [Balamuthia mandrillaris]
MPRKPHAPRNPLLAQGVERYSRSAMYRRSGRAAHKKAGKEWKKIEKTETAPVKERISRFYPAEDIKKNIPSRKSHHKPTRLRSSITPGTVLILLAGRFKGKRVIFLRQLPSGLLLVTGPFKINGVPVRRVNQAYVLATSTKVDISGLTVPDKFNDDYFRRPAKPKTQKSEEQFFAQETEKKVIDQERVKDQKEFDAQVLAIVNNVPQLSAYLNAKFTLNRKDYPHELKF